MKTSTKIGLLSSLYLSQGLPYGFFTQALPARGEDVSAFCPASVTAKLRQRLLEPRSPS